MGNSTTSLMLQEEEIAEIAIETGFSRNQIVRLYSRFLSLDRQGSLLFQLLLSKITGRSWLFGPRRLFAHTGTGNKSAWR